MPHPYSNEDAKFFLDEVVPNEWTWAITMHGSSKMIGSVGLAPDEANGGVELGYWLSRAFWGRGIVTEAARATVDFGFYRLALPVIAAGYWKKNLLSGRVLSKLGFVETGRSIRPCLALGCNVPSVEVRLVPQQTALT